MKKSLTIALPLALGAGLMMATPASAAKWDNGNKFRIELRQLDRQIDTKRGLSHREEARLHQRVDKVQSLNRKYSRNGLSRAERRTLNQRITSIKSEIRKQSRDTNSRRR